MPAEPLYLDIKLLRLLDLLYATHSVTRAAEVLGQSQSTVSIWLGRLREQLGDPLFVRTAQGMLPTPHTDALMPLVREVLGGLARLNDTQSTFDPSRSERKFSVCMTDASHITLLPQLLAHIQTVAPGLRLVASRIDADLADKLQSGQADLAIGFLPWLDTGFYQQTFYEQDWVCLANKHHPRIPNAGARHWNLKAYQAESHISILAGTGHALLDSTVTAQHIRRDIRLELPGFLGLAAILASSKLIATLPRMIGETLARSGALQVLPCPFAISGFTVKQYWHARYQHDPANRWLRGVLAGLFLQQAVPRKKR